MCVCVCACVRARAGIPHITLFAHVVSFPECRDILLPMMLRELSGALAAKADRPHDERRNSVELLNNSLEVLSRDNVVSQSTCTILVRGTCQSLSPIFRGLRV